MRCELHGMIIVLVIAMVSRVLSGGFKSALRLIRRTQLSNETSMLPMERCAAVTAGVP